MVEAFWAGVCVGFFGVFFLGGMLSWLICPAADPAAARGGGVPEEADRG